MHFKFPVSCFISTDIDFGDMPVYKSCMQYVKIVFSILMLLVVITFCVNNTQSFTLTYLGYRLSVPLQLWTLMVIFFVAGVVPIMVIEFPRQITRHLKMRAMKNQIRLMEDSLRRLAESPSDPAE